MSRRAATGESGMTLVELVVAIVILGIITGVLGTTLYLGLRTTRDNRTSLDQSNGEQLVATWLTKDIQAADAIVVAPASTCGGGAALAMTSRSDPLAATTDTVTAYALAGDELVRRTCAGGGPPATQTLAVGIEAFALQGACATTCRVVVTASASTADEGIGSYTYTIDARRRQS